MKSPYPVLPIIYPSYTHHIPIIYPSCTHHVPIIYPSYTHHIPIMYPSYTHHIPIIYPSYTHHVPIMYPSFRHPNCIPPTFPRFAAHGTRLAAPARRVPGCDFERLRPALVLHSRDDNNALRQTWSPF